MRSMIIILAILLLSGCRLEPADTALRSKLEAASDRAAARADGATDGHAWGPAIIDTVTMDGKVYYVEDVPPRPVVLDVRDAVSAAKVAAVMQANDITLPQVAAWLSQYGFDVVSRANTLRPHWSPAPPGRDAQGNIVPVAYYVANVRIAVGDTTLVLYAPQAVGPVWMRVKAYDGRGMSGAWSATEVSGSGALLPGVAE